MLERGPKLALAVQYVYLTATSLPKLAMLCFYLQVFWCHRGIRNASFVLIGLVAATWLSMIISLSLICRPLSYWWDRTVIGGTCFDVAMWYKAQSMPGPALDILIMVLPIRTLWRLNLPTAKKLGVLSAFAVASL